jgi:hypothetical protein
MLEGLPVSAISLFYNGVELMDSQKLSNMGQLFMMVHESKKLYKFQTLFSSDHDRYLDEEPVDIHCSIESDLPITLKRYKDIWEKFMGLKYGKDYELKLSGKKMTDDEAIIDDSLYKQEVYEFQVHTSLEDLR